ncbi:hypothetical protein [Pseudomonas sp. UMAB-40]|uniref:hypothetical protein n=1 Tax=Pseudomonas sp. UMAB-40 TaxID=1365407 RepID=UPI001C57E3C4|nr:hypothetical protein [Pseudomonas sp. UMAB-40]
MTASKAAPPATLKDLLRQKFKPHNKQIFAVCLVLDALMALMTLYSDNPPFDPIVYSALSAIVKAANLGLHYLSKAIQEEDPDAAAQ